MNVVNEQLVKDIREIMPGISPAALEHLAEGLYRKHYAVSTGIGSQKEYQESAT